MDKKRSFEKNLGNPILKRKIQGPGKYSVNKFPGEHPNMPRDSHHLVYFQAFDLLIYIILGKDFNIQALRILKITVTFAVFSNK